jgi:pimeloyl-ACP methyl ester carboxylesterase
MILLSLALSPFFKRPFKGRQDGTPLLAYYHEDTYSDLTATPFSFYSGKWRLRGFVYAPKGQAIKGLIVFFHGIGAGHYAYLIEIHNLAKAGYLVYAYDNTACGLSEGKDLNSLSTGVLDQNAFFRFLDNDPKAQGLTRYAVGHSWGGFLALCALNPAYHISKVVSLAGFDSVYSLARSHYPAIRFGRWLALEVQWLNYGKAGLVSGLKLMKKTTCPVLYIQGEEDQMVPFQATGLHFQKECAGHPNIHFLFRPGLAHQPYWTLEGEKYAGPILDAIWKSDYQRDLDFKIDYARFTSDDPAVLKAIIDFLAE